MQRKAQPLLKRPNFINKSNQNDSKEMSKLMWKNTFSEEYSKIIKWWWVFLIRVEFQSVKNKNI